MTANSEGVVMRSRRGICGPVLLCCSCGKRITDSRQGVVLWHSAVKDAAPMFAHVGGCCRWAEAEAAEALDSQPLSAWLIYLCNGAGLKWMKAGRLAAALSSIG